MVIAVEGSLKGGQVFKGDSVRRVGIVFSGGPAPSANAVIAAAATAFLEDGREVIGFLNGYSRLQEYDADKRPLVEGEDYFIFKESDLRGLRNERGIIVGTARANPGKPIKTPKDLKSPDATAGLRRVYDALTSLRVDALISIGGDDTLKTANFLHAFQEYLKPGEKRVRVVHLPKTIDNDYGGIDFTFGFFTAVDVMAKELLNIRADAMASGAYFIAEVMGRKAGWLGYGVAMGGEAHLVLTVEDIDSSLTEDENGTPKLSMAKLANRIVDLMLVREERKKTYGVVVLAEGLVEHLSSDSLVGMSRDDHGHIALGDVELGKRVAVAVAARYTERTGRKRKVNGLQMGYESRCAPPHSFDVMLGSQLGVGAYRGLVEEGLDGHMVSVTGQFDLRYVPFTELVNPETLVTEVRFLPPGSDFHKLARFLETRIGQSTNNQ